MKKILIVNNNMDMGGIQKSLVNLLKETHNNYDITLLLFSKSGALLKDVPNTVKVITPNKCYRMLGLTKEMLKKHPILFGLKFLLMKYTSIFSRRRAMRLLGIFQRKISGYDTVISYSHLPSHKYFGNGCGDFVLDKVICKNKICLIHCDYINSGCMTTQNNDEYTEFDKIACCSDSVRERFIAGTNLPQSKVYTLRNFYDFDIIKLANIEPYAYKNDCINILMVARLSPEKGIDKAIDVLLDSGRKDIKYYIIGSGPQEKILKNKIKNYGMENQVFLLGEQLNPYKYMINADYLLVPSLHEAAPMVFDEAKILGLRIISTNTISAKEIITEDNGIICETIKDIQSVLSNLRKNNIINKSIENNKIQTEQFENIANS